MAECLILAFQPNNRNNDVGWNRGDVVSIRPDGWQWGLDEGLPKFWRIIVTGASVADCEGYIAQSMSGSDVLKNRVRRLDYDSLSTPQKRALNENGFLTVTKAQADAFIASIA